MMLSLSLLAVALIGLLIYVLSTNPKSAEIGRIMFFCGLLVLCFHGFGEVVVRLGGR